MYYRTIYSKCLAMSDKLLTLPRYPQNGTPRQKDALICPFAAAKSTDNISGYVK